MKKKLLMLTAIIICIASLIFAFTGCNIEDKLTLVAPSNIVYDGATIRWNKVTHAEYYTVQINGGEEIRTNINYFSYNANGQGFDITVNALAGDKKESASMHFQQLKTIENFTVNDQGIISWNAVDMANAYVVDVNGTEETITENQYLMKTGFNQIKVKPIVSGNSGYYSFWSDVENYTKYMTPKNIDYDGEFFTWEGDAPLYEVKINGVARQVDRKSFAYKSNEKTIDVEIKAIGDHTITFDSEMENITFYYLDVVTGIKLVDGVLTWNPIENAEGYEICIDGNYADIHVVNGASFDGLPEAQVDVQIRPFNKSGNYFTAWCDKKKIEIMQSPKVTWNRDLQLDGEARNNFMWNPVLGAKGYQVVVKHNGVETKYDYEPNITSYLNAYLDSGDYSVKVKTIGDGINVFDSKFSKEVIVTRLQAPQINNITSDPSDVKSGFTINFDKVNYANYIQLYKDGAKLDAFTSYSNSMKVNEVVDDSKTEQQEYVYSLQSIGAVEESGGKTYVYLDSLKAKNTSFNIKVLAMPINVQMLGYRLKWNGTTGANDYSIKQGQKKSNSNLTEYDLSKLFRGEHKISVCANGDGKQVLASNYTVPITINRLSYPQNIRIIYSAGNGLLQYDSVTNAKSYQAFLDVEEKPLAFDSFDKMYNFISEQGTVLKMQSNANYYNSEKTIYYMTSEMSPSQMFIKLADPVFPEACLENGKELVWNAPTNIKEGEYAPSYEIYDDANVLISGGLKNSTKYSIANLEGGRKYTFCVKAIGNDTKYLDSGKSRYITFEKLATPNMKIENNKYVWTGVSNCDNYMIETDEGIVNKTSYDPSNSYEYTPSFNKIGQHTIKLTALGDGRTTVNSDPYIHEQIVKKLNAPDYDFKYIQGENSRVGSVEVTITNNNSLSNGFIYEIAGETFTSNNAIETRTIDSSGKHTIRARAKGAFIDDATKIYYIDSDYGYCKKGEVITFLPAPSQSSIKVNRDGVFQWSTIDNSLGYDYSLTIDNVEGEIVHTRYQNSSVIPDFNTKETITIKIRACGNGENIIDSDWVYYTWRNVG